MSLSDAERKALTKAVVECRRLLEREARDQLERIYGFTRDGAARPLEGLPLSSLEEGAATAERDAGELGTWRDAAEKVWTELQEGQHDWSHLTLWLRRDEVLARCQSERDLAIAHGREDLYVPPSAKPRRGLRRRAAQLLLTDGAGGNHD